MKIKHLMSSMVIVSLALGSFQANAGNINATAARTVASKFIQGQADRKSVV